MGRERSAEPLEWQRWNDGIDETLARSADQERQAEHLQAVEPRDRHHALFRRLAETDAGIEHDEVARNAGARRDGERAFEEGGDVGHDVDERVDDIAVVHDNDRRPVARDDAGHLGIALQTPDIVDDGGATVECPGCDHRLHGVDRNRPPHSRSEEHTSELQSRENLVCRLLLEKKKKKKNKTNSKKKKKNKKKKNT